MSKIDSLLFIVGMVLALGSIATFIVMNVAVGSSSDATLIQHQRLFVTANARALTVPGVCLLFAATILSTSFWGHQPLADGWGLAQLVLACLIFINTMVFVRPLVTEVSQLADQGAAQGKLLESYLRRKKLEDRLGAVNFVMIMTTLLLAAFRP